MVTARIEEIDRLLGLELGADDYICKPFSPREMVARVKAVLRRLQHRQQLFLPVHWSLILTVSGYLPGQEVELTTVEFQLLQALYQQPDVSFPLKINGSDLSGSTHSLWPDIDSHIKKLRKKLSDLLPEQELIHSVYGAGYRYDPQVRAVD